MTATSHTRILIVDDSAVMRSLLRSVVCSDAGLEVAGTAADGASALNSLTITRPDLILLDVEMPVMDGLVTLRELRRRGHRMPVIMCSSLTQRGAKVTIEALAGGASDYVTKPAGQASREAAQQALGMELLPKIQALTQKPGAQSPLQAPGQPQRQSQPLLSDASRTSLFLPAAPPLRMQSHSSNATVVTIGVSTGGPAALDVLLPALPGNFPLPVLIVQHMPELFTRLFADRLNGRCNLSVHEAVEGEPLRAGTVYIARGNWHMEAQPAQHPITLPTVRLSQGPLENHCRPAVDVLFRSAARVYGAGVLSVVLTGMGSDGMTGCRTIREQGGSVLAQDQASSTVWGMPGAVVNAGLAQKVLPLDAIAPEIIRIASRSHCEIRDLYRQAVS